MEQNCECNHFPNPLKYTSMKLHNQASCLIKLLPENAVFAILECHDIKHRILIDFFQDANGVNEMSLICK